MNSETGNNKNWVSTLCDLGEHKPDVTLTAKFEFISETRKVASYRAGCGCTDLTYQNNVLAASYTTRPLSDSQKVAGLTKTQVSKHVYVTYDDGSQETLKLFVIVTL